MAQKIGWKSVMKSLGRPKVAVMLMLGISSGLPFMLVGNTLNYWLRDSGVDLTTIGFASWVGLAYSMKFLWAPLIDKVHFPIIGKMLGRRRGWMLATQFLVATGFIAMSIFKPEGGILIFVAFAGLAALAASTQDTVIDAWRIEVSDDGDEMAMLSATYQLGYRIALIATQSWILFIASAWGWPTSYLIMGLSMVIGVLGVLFAMEPGRTKVQQASVKFSLMAVFDAVVQPFVDFLQHHGNKALLILAAVSLYRLADFVMGPMADPFYVDLGLSKEMVASVRTTIGIVGSVAGVAAGGLSAVRFGLMRTLLMGAFLGPFSNLAFTLMAMVGARTDVFAGAIFVDNFAGGFAGVALVGYMSSLTSMGYTATQYALLSSFYALLGKLLKGFSGMIVDHLNQDFGQLPAYAIFFAGTAAIGVPALICCFFLDRATPTKAKA
jgi:PAT family beta-lactamase induction signal transducer AmpG